MRCGVNHLAAKAVSVVDKEEEDNLFLASVETAPGLAHLAMQLFFFTGVAYVVMFLGL